MSKLERAIVALRETVAAYEDLPMVLWRKNLGGYVVRTAALAAEADYLEELLDALKEAESGERRVLDPEEANDCSSSLGPQGRTH